MSLFNATGSFLNRVHGGTRHDPVRDWLVLLSIAGLILAGVIVWNVWVFDSVANGGTIGSVEGGPATTNKVSLEEIRAVFEERAVEKARYATGVYRYADPSQ